MSSVKSLNIQRPSRASVTAQRRGVDVVSLSPPNHRMLLRPRLNCHYCGGRSSSRQKKGGKFTCQYCQAVNFLDENGDIADIPADEIAEAERPVRFTESSSTTAGSQEDSLFCSTCIKNQLLYTNALSEYLPDPDDPKYEQYEAALPNHKKDLEDRYPQVCAQCEPRVRQKLQQAVYTARADHVRRMLDRSRARRVAYGWGWRSLVVRFTGAGAVLSIIAQLSWHLMGAVFDPNLSLHPDDSVICPPYAFMLRSVPKSCVNEYSAVAGYALVLGMLCLWWNPKWMHKLEGREGRLIGLDQYYKLQAGLMVLRFLSWLLLKETESFDITSSTEKSLHGICLVLSILMFSWSLIAVIHVDTVPLVNWQQDPAPLLSKTQYVPPTDMKQALSFSQNSQVNAGTSQHFTIGNHGSGTRTSYTPWRPPTPPEDVDVMEWEPIRQSFQPRTRPQPKKKVEASPFYGKLPTLGNPGRLQYENAPAPREAIGIPPGFFEQPKSSWPLLDGPTLAEPKFNPPQIQDPDTGLESIFGKIFSLDNGISGSHPNYLRQDHLPQSEYLGQQISKEGITKSQLPGPGQQWSSTSSIAAVATGTLLICTCIWLFSDLLPTYSSNVKLSVNIVAMCIPMLHILLNFKSIKRTSDYLYFVLEFGAFALLAVFRLRYDCALDGLCDKLVLAMMSGMLWQEFYMIWIVDGPAVSVPSSSVWQSATQSRSITDTIESTNHGKESIVFGAPNLGNTISQPTDSSQPMPDSSTIYSRPRTNSIESTTTSLSTNTSSTASAWGRTPKAASIRAPGFGIEGLTMDTSYGTSVAGPRRRNDGSGTARNLRRLR